MMRRVSGDALFVYSQGAISCRRASLLARNGGWVVRFGTNQGFRLRKKRLGAAADESLGLLNERYSAWF